MDDRTHPCRGRWMYAWVRGWKVLVVVDQASCVDEEDMKCTRKREE